MILVTDKTESRCEYWKNFYSSEFSRWLGGTGADSRSEKYRLTPEQIQAKVDEKTKGLVFIEAVYSPLRMQVDGVWNSERQELVATWGGADPLEETFHCASKWEAEKALAKLVRTLIPVAEANL